MCGVKEGKKLNPLKSYRNKRSITTRGAGNLHRINRRQEGLGQGGSGGKRLVGAVDED